MLALSVAFLVILSASFAVFHHIQIIQDAPYMDEIFHMPQAKKYCSFNFSYWDPMITTLPGLYLSSLVILSPVASLQNLALADVCSTWSLRAGNLLYCCGNLVLLYLLHRQLNGVKEKHKTSLLATIHAMTLTLMPVSYFFTWLYYTDPGSLFFTLLMYLLCLKGQHFLSAVSGLVAILFRQTNIIWVFFCFALTAKEILEHRLRLDKKVPNLRRLSDWEMFKVICKHVFLNLRNFTSLLITVLQGTIWYLFLMLCFVVFVVINKGIVVGDRTHHVVSTNYPQVFYFLLVSGTFSFSHIAHPRQVKQFLKSVIRHPIRVLTFILISCILIQYFTYEHKYLLSDNRHYTFYVWSKVFRRHKLIKFCLIPVYLYGLYQFFQATIEKGFIWRVSVCVCVAFCLVPQALLEFRYFIIPFYIIRLNMKEPKALALVIELIVALTVNIFTIYMFSEKPFYWPNDSSPQRFMW